MININYKQIITYFSSIAYHHEQINSFGIGDYHQLINNVETKQERKYTTMYVVPESVEFNENHIHYSFNVVIADQIEDDLSNQKEVMSDTLQTAQDVWTIFWQSYTSQDGNFSQIVVGDWDASIEPFLERFTTVLGGWTLRIRLSAPFNYDSCNLPIVDDYTFPQDESFSSYKQILVDWEQFADAHEQINSFGYGDITQLVNNIDTKKEPLFPRIYFLPETTMLQENHMHMRWRVIVCDIVNDDLSNQVDVWSDTLEIAKDFYAKAYLSDYEVDWNAVLTPWFENEQTRLAGWTFEVSINQKFDYNRCVLPTSNFSPSLTWEELDELWRKVKEKWAKV